MEDISEESFRDLTATVKLAMSVTSPMPFGLVAGTTVELMINIFTTLTIAISYIYISQPIPVPAHQGKRVLERVCVFCGSNEANETRSSKKDMRS